MSVDAAARVAIPALEVWLETLESIADREERIQTLIELAKRFREVPPEVATRPFPVERRVPGCESEAYVWATPAEAESLRFEFAVENPQGLSAKALAALLTETLAGAPPAAVAARPRELVYRLFGRELSMGKSMGLMGMVDAVRHEAARAIGRAGGARPATAGAALQEGTA